MNVPTNIPTVDDVGRMLIRDLAPRLPEKRKPNGQVIRPASRHGLTREQIEAMSPKARELRRQRLLADPTPCTIAGLAALFDTSEHAVLKWRGEYLKTGEAAGNALPPPANDDECRQPGDGQIGTRAGTPVWTAGEARRWGAQSDHMDADFWPKHRRPPGRTPRNGAEPVDLVAEADVRATHRRHEEALDEVAAFLTRKTA